MSMPARPKYNPRCAAAPTWSVAATSTTAVALHSNAAAGRVRLAVHIVDAADGGPELVFARPRRGERRLLARVRMVPLVSANGLCSMRGVLQRVVQPVHRPRLNRLHLGVNRNHRVAEPIQFRLR